MSELDIKHYFHFMTLTPEGVLRDIDMSSLGSEEPPCCDLMEALEDCVRLAEYAMRVANREGAEFDVDGCLTDARAAIAKAKGDKR